MSRFYGHRAPPLIQFHTNSHKSLISRPNEMFALCVSSLGVFPCNAWTSIKIARITSAILLTWSTCHSLILLRQSFVLRWSTKLKVHLVVLCLPNNNNPTGWWHLIHLIFQHIDQFTRTSTLSLINHCQSPNWVGRRDRDKGRDFVC